MPEILYPLAKDAAGGQAWIKDAVRGGEYFCWECSGQMTPKQGEVNRWHYAHRTAAALVGGCGEGALHRAIKLGLQNLVSRAETLTLRYRCLDCPEEIFDAVYAGPFRVVAEDGGFCGGARVDLGIYGPEGMALAAIEVVDTHRLERQTAALLRERGLPVWEVTAAWELAHQLSDFQGREMPALVLEVVSPGLNVTPPACKDTCPQCGKGIRLRRGVGWSMLQLPVCARCLAAQEAAKEQRRKEIAAQPCVDCGGRRETDGLSVCRKCRALRAKEREEKEAAEKAAREAAAAAWRAEWEEQQILAAARRLARQCRICQNRLKAGELDSSACADCQEWGWLEHSPELPKTEFCGKHGRVYHLPEKCRRCNEEVPWGIMDERHKRARDLIAKSRR